MATFNKIQIGKEIFFAEFAQTLPTWLKGLSGRDSMKKSQGLLFIYGREAVRAFWMKDMKFPLDIILLDDGLKVVEIMKNLPVPKSMLLDPPKYISSVPIRYALEINVGMSEKVEIGDQLKLLREIPNK